MSDLWTGAVETPTVYMVDVSKWQLLSRIDWVGLREEKNVQLVIARAGEGLEPDPSCARHLLEAQEGGIERAGCYHALKPSLAIAPQAAILVTACNKVGSESLAVVDFELSDGRTPASQVRALIRFCDVAESMLGRPIIVYTNPGFVESLALPTSMAERLLWVSHYGVSKPRIPKPWTSWWAWQYDGTGGEKHMGIDLDFSVLQD